MEAILCRLVASNGRLFMMELARHLADLLQTIGSRNEQQQQQQRWLERDRERIDFAWQALLQFRSSYCRFLRRNESDAIVSDGLASSSGVVADALMQRIIDTSANDAAEFIGKLEWKYEVQCNS
jgi:hypothetical protein